MAEVIYLKLPQRTIDMDGLNDVIWKPFAISDIFTIGAGKRLEKSNMCKGKIPFVGSSDSNNGITAFISNINNSYDGNVLGVNYNGSVVENFYHPYHAIFSDDVKRFHLKRFKGNKYIYLFFKVIILQQKCKFQYGYKFNEERMQSQQILVPVTLEGTPDYVFMEEYMRTKEKDLINRYLRYILNNITELQKEISAPKISVLKWKAFAITDIFKITATKSGIDKCRLSNDVGNYPYITRTDRDNGWDKFVCEQNYPSRAECANVISIGLDTQTVFYQPISFYTGQNIQILASPHFDRYVATFILPLLKIQMQKFNWGGNGATLSRLKKLHIMLPVTASGNPDYVFMNNYMKIKEKHKVIQYLNYMMSRE